ncbi:hypothetical protein GCM10022254_02030 [Actinomadura meridiana]|uniref:eCIS core domain-containing protein n=1 Tax=Actinomadura meridiana TaxID=559626 RepID=A0ABP8BSK3_9ACTN
MRDHVDPTTTNKVEKKPDAAGAAKHETSSQGLLALQAKAGNAAVSRMLRRGGGAPVQRSAVPSVLRGRGRPIDERTRTDMEARLGADFSDVRVHDDAVARTSAAEVGARAYTSGNHVVIGRGGAGRHTLAHELVHVIQQRSGPVAGTDQGDGLRVSDPGDRFERDAETRATRALRGSAPAAPTVPPPTGAPHAEATIQRATIPGTAQQQLAQYTQLDNLPAMWVPPEEFDENGRLEQTPTRASVVQRPEWVNAPRMEREMSLPRREASRRGGVLQTSWKFSYQTSFHIYDVEAINNPQGPSPILIDRTGWFRILAVRPKGSKGRSMGRTYRFGDYWDINLDFLTWIRNEVPDTDERTIEQLAERRGLKQDDRVPANRDAFVRLPSEQTQPFVFYTNNVLDEAFTHGDGTRKDDRRFKSVEDFSAQLDAVTAANKVREQVGLSHAPVTDRQTGGRNPIAAMSGFPAHSLMSQSGRGGRSGRPASHEWCHLIGDNDGGPTIFQNLVVGTNAVNTEQLAMESALRDFRASMDGLGLAIRLKVTALVERTEAENPVVPGNPYNKADWIRFVVDIVKKDGGPDVSARQSLRPVHRQIMDAKRGTITESEFTSLHHQVRNAMRKAHEKLLERQREEEERERSGSPMSVDA